MTNEQKTPEETKKKIKQGSTDLWSGIKDFVHDWLNLKDDLDREGTITNIQNNKRMRGANAWLLVCSIMVASLGLNLNSPAVIIGAMLISPLMSPILGIGLSVGINDRKALWVSLQHFGMSVAIALVTSFIYFYFTPIDEFTNEIAGRTEPGILDVLVAIFGGLAGIISGSRIDKSNAIPGVAIATALMPPLCVTGYGLAQGEWEIAFNSFYLFFMNSTFIAMTTYALVSFMDFPKRKYETKAERVRTRRILGAFALLMFIPSLFIFAKVVKKADERRTITQFVEQEFPNSILELANDKSNDSLEVKVFVFEDISDDDLANHYQELSTLNCSAKYSIIDAQKSGITKEELDKTTKSMQADYLRQIESEKKQITTEKDKQIASLETTLDSLQRDTVIFKSAAKELQALFPDLEEIRYARMQTQKDSVMVMMPTFLVHWSKKKTKRSRTRDDARIGNFLRLREGLEDLQIVEF